MLCHAISGFLTITMGVMGIQLPNPTGRYPVGTVSLELIDDSRIGPFASTHRPRDIMISVFYPTSETAVKSGNYSVAPDHPYDALITEYPNGDVVSMPTSVLDDFPSKMPSLVEVRVGDVEFIASALKNSSTLSQIPGLNSSGTPLRSDQIGIFGHSLGGATAAQAVSNSTTFPCGANFDGGIFGPVAQLGLNKPFLQIGAQDHNQTTDTTFAAFWDHLHGFRREFIVNGTVHLAFTDVPILRDLLGEAFPAQQKNQSGTIAGEALLEIETALIDTFFAFCLKGKSVDDLDILARGRFPEVSVP